MLGFCMQYDKWNYFYPRKFFKDQIINIDYIKKIIICTFDISFF